MTEIIIKASNIEEAIKQGCSELGVLPAEVEASVIAEPKKGLFGAIKQAGEYKIVSLKKQSKLTVAQNFISNILDAMGYNDYKLIVSENNMGTIITINCDDVGTLIGRRGETIDSLQYLVSLAINKIEGDFLKIKIDCGDYRSKREKTLMELAKNVAKNVAKTGYSSTLEPMNPYERRIIHSVVGDIVGVSSKSVGEEPHRKVQIVSTKSPNKQFKKDAAQPQVFKNPLKSDDEVAKVNIAKIEVSSFEQEYKRSTQTEQEKSAKLYEKLF
jgi:spoIIIJ-associated protein